MLNLSINEQDKQWLHKDYPELKFGVAKDGHPKITGNLVFDMVFYKDGKPYVINPTKDNLSGGERIKDRYQIEIIFKASEYSNLPQVLETGSRLKTVAESTNLQLIDLHVNPTGPVCLCVKLEEEKTFPNGFSLPEFIHKLVVPFFYAQSYFEKHNTWPWGQYSHGVLGLFEWYLEQQNITKEKLEEFADQLKRDQKVWQVLHYLLIRKSGVKGHNPCLCGSSKKYRNCHQKVFNGMWRLKKDMEILGVTI